MQVAIRHNPSFAVARVSLAPGEPAQVEAGAMAAMSPDMTVQAQLQGGLMKSLARGALGGESLFITTYTAGPYGGWVDVAPNLPGDVVVLTASPERSWNLSKGCWLTSEWSVSIDTKWGGFGNLIGGEGGFLMRATGHGQLLVSCFGALDVHRLGQGERLVLDTGHLVAYTDGIGVSTRRMGGSTMTALKSGEGLVFEFTGPGEVLGQSRNPAGLVSYLAARGLGARS
ncbi:MAG: TIGR00266 family protein [Geodermatophilaceae bacterium]|nr:TIGR00266 family protein [Geodermatophilaceae bacterium]